MAFFHAGDVIRKWREQRGLSNLKLAQLAGVDKNTISRIEAGENTTVDTVQKVAAALGHSFADIHAALGIRDLSEDDLQLLRDFHRLGPGDQSFIRRTIAHFRRRGASDAQ